MSNRSGSGICSAEAIAFTRPLNEGHHPMTADCELIVYDPWLAGIFQRDVYRLDPGEGGLEKNGPQKDRTYRKLKEIQAGPVFIYAKVSTASLSACRFLEEMGFKLMDTNVVFDKPAAPGQKLRGNCALRLAVPEDREQVVELAGRNFAFSRFHLDDAIPKMVADRIMAEWAGNFFSGNRGNQMVVALTGEKIVGFTQLLRRGGKTTVIDLIGVDKGQRQKGIASDMIAFAESQCSDCDRIWVGTQVANIPSMRLYEKMGFRIFVSRYVFHYHTFSR